jgi:Flp pilus assembly protein TadG
MKHFIGLLGSFRSDRRGNVAVIFAFAILPILGFVGAAVDYSIAARTQTKIEAALDTAVLLATSKYEATLPAATAQADAIQMFGAQLSTFGATTSSSSIVVTDTPTGRTAVGTASSVVPTTFMKVMGFNSLTVNGSSTSKVGLPTYVDFYLLLDNTPSMGVAATPADVTTMVNNTPDQCAFACHNIYTDSSEKYLATSTYYSLAQSLGVTTRIDVVRQATQQLMTTAASTETVANQFRMAIYTLGASCASPSLTTITPLTSSLTSAQTAASNITLMTTPYQGYNNDQCTDFDNVLAAMNTTIPTPGPGTASQPQKYLFYVSDGVADAYYPSTCTEPTTGGRCQEPLTLANCTAIKNRGITIAVLYTTYLALPTNAWYNQWIAPFNVGPYGPSPNSLIAQNMQSCASPGFYFEVSPTQGISSAMNALFQKAVSMSHLTN